ncbi:fibronectin type III domain-containing protein [Nocardioides sp. JQ2195]|nr:fibronectin type III domain-containing protein [Nocardioides sp. JQ2195]
MTIVLTTLALFHDGTEVADLELNDGGVWVTNENLNGLQVAAHLNYPSRQLDANTASIPGAGFDLSQEANSVVLATGATQLRAVDTATWQADPTPATLPASAHSSQGSDVVAIADPNAGKVWAVSATEVAGFDPESVEPVMENARGVRVVTGKDDVIHTVRPDGELRDLRRDSDSWVVEDVGSVPGISDLELQDLQLSAVGGTGVVLNPDAGWLAWPGERVDLDDASTLRLQQPGDDTGRIALGGPSGLVQVSLEDDSVETLPAPDGGTPIPPVTVGACVYAAWTGTGAYLRDCTSGADDVDVATYPQLRTSRELVFRTNRDVVVLNDPTNGDVFLVNENMQEISDWQTVLANLNQDENDKQDKTIAVSERSEKNTPPEPRDDEFGVRPGQSVTLPVLGNDRDADGDILVADLDERQVAGVGTLEPVRDGRAVRISVDADASPGRVADFTYTANDGRENGTADASVALTVRGEAQNAHPELLVAERPSQLKIRSRGSGEHHILQEWVDPDGDPFWVSKVEFPEGLSGTYRPDGLIKVRDDGRSGLPRERVVEVTLTDGRLNGSHTVDLTVTVLPVDGRAKPIANADYVTTLATGDSAGSAEGSSVTVRPLANDVDPNGDELFFSLSGRTPEGLRVEQGEDDSLTITGTDPGSTAYLEYTVTDGRESATSVVRVDTIAPEVAQPVPDDDLAVLPPGGEALVDVLSNDTDPLGGVLVVESVNVGQSTEVTAEVVDHESIKLSDVSLKEGQPVTITYDVGNGSMSGTGTVTVVLDPARTPEAPVAADDAAVVRSGDVVTANVLDNDLSPTDLPLTVLPLADDAITSGADLGQAWVSENKVRFRATGESGTARVQYTVRDTEQRTHSATVEVTITPTSGANAAPRPEPMTGRLVQGGDVVLPVPLEGVDPDGDSVSLVGLDIENAPGKGSVSFDGSSITYTAAAGEQNRGTDTFAYVVEDEFGLRSTGEVRIGIAAAPVNNLPPIAITDERDVRPGRGLTVPVTVNDIDPEGGALTILDDVEQVDGPSAPAEVVDGRVRLTTPDDEATLTYRYRIRDDLGAESTSDLVVKVRKDAPALPPIARDDRIPVANIIGRSKVTADVLANDEDPDGSITELAPQVAAGLREDGVEVAGGQLTIPVRPERQLIVYRLVDPDGEVGTAVVVVPGSDSEAAKRPALRPGVELPIPIDAGATGEIDLDDYVVVRDGRSPSLPFTESIVPGPGHDGSKLKADDSVIAFGARKGFHGDTSVSAVVSDANGSDDASALTSTLTLPVFVNADGNTRPELRVPAITVAPGEPWSGDLDLMATDPDPGDQGNLAFSTAKVDPGLDVRVDDGSEQVTVQPDGGTRPGQYQFDLVVSDGRTAAVSRTANVTVVESTRDPLTVRDAQLTADSGEPITIDLADYVTNNPFEAEGDPVELVSGPTVVAGQTDAVDSSGLEVTVTPARDFHGTVLMTYVLGDATGLAEREVQGRITLDVRGLPSAPTTITADAGNGQVEVDWSGAAPNGAPMTGYRLTWKSTGGDSGQARINGPQTTHTVTGLTNGDAHQFQVHAINEVGESPSASPWSRTVTPDYVPATPANLAVSFDDQQLHTSWSMPTYEGSAVKRFEVSYNGRIIDAGTDLVETLAGLTNGTSYRIKVRAINDAEADPHGTPGASGWSAEVTEHPNAEPTVSAVSIVADAPDDDPSAEISWTPQANGHPVADFQVRRVGGKVVACAGPSTGNGCRVSLAGGGRDQQFQVRLLNRANPDRKLGIDGWGEWSEATTRVTGATTPDAVQDLQARPTGTSGQAKVSFSYSTANMNNADSVEFYSSETGTTPIARGPGAHSFTVSGLANGTGNTIEVWARGSANTTAGGGSADSARREDSVNTFGPCTVDVSNARSGYRSVTFDWRVTSNGRTCAWSGTGGFPSGSGGSRSGSHKVTTSGDGQSATLTVNVTTRTGSGDPSVPGRSDSASGTSYRLRSTFYNAGTAPAPSGNCLVDCYWIGVEAFEAEPGSTVWCPITYEGQHDNGVTHWHESAGVADSSGHLKSRLKGRNGLDGAPANLEFNGPGEQPPNICRQNRP